jgi:hypothetical protein
VECAECGAALREGVRFCAVCGTAVAGAGSAAAPPAAVERDDAAPVEREPTATSRPVAAAPAAQHSTSTLQARRSFPVAPTVVAIAVLVGVLVFAVARGGSDRSASSASGSDAPQAAQPAEAPDRQPADSAAPDATEPTSLLPDASEAEMAADVQALLLDFHQDVVSGSPRAAWALLSARKRAQVRREDGYAAWSKAQASLSGYLDPGGIEVTMEDTDPDTGVARVRVTGMDWSKPGAGCAQWSGLTWVKYEDGTWTYDPGYSTTPERRRQWERRFDDLLGGSC